MKVVLGLATLTHDELADKADTIHTSMVSAAATFTAPVPTMPTLATFTAPVPTMPTLATDTAALRAAIAARLAGEAALKILVQNESHAADVVRADLTQEASYVDGKANGNAATIILAGMGVRKTATPVGPMPKVLNLKTTTSDYPGKADWMCGPVPGVRSFIVQKCTGDPAVEANWSYADVSTKSSGTVPGLPAGKVWLRVLAKGADDNLGPPSDPAEEVVR